MKDVFLCSHNSPTENLELFSSVENNQEITLAWALVLVLLRFEIT